MNARSTSTAVEQIAAAVLYEGYLLCPYRRSAKKNQRRWTFGGVYPRAYSEAVGGHDPWRMQTQCLVTGAAPRVQVTVRFLHVVERRVGRQNATGHREFVDALQVGPERYLAWEEAAERQLVISVPPLADLTTPGRVPIEIAAGCTEEPLKDVNAAVVGVLVRNWQALAGAVEVTAVAVQEGLFKLTVHITNTTPWHGQDRVSTLRQTLVSTHTILRVDDGAFVSLMDPPAALKEAFQQAFTHAAAGTEAETAAVDVVVIPIQAVCRTCEAEVQSTDVMVACPQCGGVDLEITAGDELVLESIEYEDPAVYRQ